MNRKELTQKYREKLARGESVHGEARDLIVDEDLSQAAKNAGLLAGVATDGLTNDEYSKAFVRYSVLRDYVCGMEGFARQLSWKSDDSDFLNGYQLAMRQVFDFIRAIREVSE